MNRGFTWEVSAGICLPRSCFISDRFIRDPDNIPFFHSGYIAIQTRSYNNVEFPISSAGS